MKLKLWIWLLCLTMTILACAVANGMRSTPTSTGISTYPPATFQEADLVGTWQGWRDEGEMLILRADRTFKQIYDAMLETGSYHFEGEGTWWLEYRPSGCVYIHLEGMRYYHLDYSTAETGNRHSHGLVSFWDYCEERVIEMPDKVIMIVGSHRGFLKDIKLEHMAMEINASTEILQLIHIPMPDSDLATTPTP
ncbi:MAG: hypothetical protein GY796_28845 [Chloroflexi bacterium]|nr:hypothetical protein [Chloroflexota bacterium]